MRLFIAIRLDDAIKNALTGMQATLRAARVSGNYTKIENLHLTLAFIGEYGDPDRVLEVMRTVPFEPIPIRLEGFGSFGDLYWCGLAQQDRLTAYVKRLRRTLAETGIPFDRKHFSPHITLLRKASFDRMPCVHDGGRGVADALGARKERYDLYGAGERRSDWLVMGFWGNRLEHGCRI